MERLAVRFDNEPQFKALMKHFESKGWRSQSGHEPLYFTKDSIHPLTVVLYEDKFTFSQDYSGGRTLLSFDQFSTLTGVKVEEEIPEYVECIVAASRGFTQGKIYPLNRRGDVIDNDGDAIVSWDGSDGARSKFKPSTKEAYDHQQKKEALVAEAKRRGFKKGVKVICLATSDDAPETIDTDVIEYELFREKDHLWMVTEEARGWGALIYKDGKWAEIVEEGPFGSLGSLKTTYKEDGSEKFTVYNVKDITKIQKHLKKINKILNK